MEKIVGLEKGILFLDEDVLFNMKWEVGNLIKERKPIEIILFW